jgi:Rieske Fe-S protein
VNGFAGCCVWTEDEDGDRTERQMTEQGFSRRTVLGVGIAGVGALGLAACGAGGTASTPPAAANGGAGGGRSSGSANGPAGVRLAKLADVPVGGSAAAAATVDGDPVVVSQKDAHTVAAFSAICTHMGCTVNAAGTQFHCPCHGSVYDAFTGAVVHGPAPRPLTKIQVTVSAGEIVTA